MGELMLRDVTESGLYVWRSRDYGLSLTEVDASGKTPVGYLFGQTEPLPDDTEVYGPIVPLASEEGQEVVDALTEAGVFWGLG